MYTLYVNGASIGQGDNFQQSQGYCVKLGSGCNVFAVAVQNGGTTPSPAALLVAINVTYNDGTSSIVVSDDSWRANGQTAGFQDVDFDDSMWPYAVIVGASASSAPWGLPALPISGSALTLANHTGSGTPRFLQTARPLLHLSVHLHSAKRFRSQAARRFSLARSSLMQTTGILST